MKTNVCPAHDINLSNINTCNTSSHLADNLVPGVLQAGEEITPGTLCAGEDVEPSTLHMDENLDPWTLYAE